MKDIVKTILDNPLILILIALISAMIVVSGCTILQELVYAIAGCGG